MDQMKNTSILVIDEYPLFHEALQTIIGKIFGYEIIGDAETGLEGFQMATELSPDLILMDISLPDMCGLKLIRTLKNILPQTRIIVLSLHAENEYISEALDMGANGFFSKLSGLELLVEDLSINQNELYLMDSSVQLQKEIESHS